jgi:hypothetical protein
MRARHLRWGMRSRLADHPSLYIPLARFRHRGTVVGADTRLVIDGFTRSGVTFAVIAFQVAQREPVRVAHTLHAPAHVMAAVRRGVPTIVTIRHPEAAVLSAIIREPYVTAEQGIAAWIRFYSRILPFRSGFVSVPFEAVTHDYGAVIRGVNDRFGTTFDEFAHTPENVEVCFRIIEDRARRPPWSVALGDFENGRIGLADYLQRVDGHGEARPRPRIPESRVPRPSPERDAMKETLATQVWGPGLRKLRLRARELYAEYGGVSVTPLDPPEGTVPDDD